MEKQILIPIILVLGLLTCGIGIYLYIRCRNEHIEALKQIVIDEQINKPVETSIDNTTNVCDDIIIPVGDDVVVEENLDRIVRVGNLRMTERARRELQNGWQDVRQSYSTMMNNQIAGLERLEQGCDDFIEQCNVTKAGMDQTRQTIGELKSINGFQMAYYEAAAKNAERNLNTRK